VLPLSCPISPQGEQNVANASIRVSLERSANVECAQFRRRSHCRRRRSTRRASVTAVAPTASPRGAAPGTCRHERTEEPFAARGEANPTTSANTSDELPAARQSPRRRRRPSAAMKEPSHRVAELQDGRLHPCARGTRSVTAGKNSRAGDHRYHQQAPGMVVASWTVIRCQPLLGPSKITTERIGQLSARCRQDRRS
jgi:hypothetical protein